MTGLYNSNLSVVSIRNIKLSGTRLPESCSNMQSSVLETVGSCASVWQMQQSYVGSSQLTVCLKLFNRLMPAESATCRLLCTALMKTLLTGKGMTQHSGRIDAEV